MSRTTPHNDPNVFWRKVLAIVMRRESVECVKVTQQQIDEEPIVLLDIDHNLVQTTYRMRRQEIDPPESIDERENWYRKTLSAVMRRHGIERFDISDQDIRREPVAYDTLHVRPHDVLISWKIQPLLPEPAPALPVPSEIAQHGAPPDTNPEAMQAALEGASVPTQQTSCSCRVCGIRGDIARSLDYRCKIDDCMEFSIKGSHYCRAHLCLHSNRPLCAVRHCSNAKGMVFFCSAHNARWVFSPESGGEGFVRWLSQFEHPAPATQAGLEHVAVGRAMGVGHMLGATFAESFSGFTTEPIQAGQPVTEEMVRRLNQPQPPIVIHFSTPTRGNLDNAGMGRAVRRAMGIPEQCCRGDCTERREPGHAFCATHRLPPQEVRR